jgi:hypothetical protein
MLTGPIRGFFALVAASAVALLATPGATQTCQGLKPNRTCIKDGELPQAHRLGQFLFDTNSHIEKSGPIWHVDVCIQNIDKSNDLYYYWFVPQIEGWLPPNEYREGCHYSSDPKYAQFILDSCLEYGNVNATTKAQLWGDTILEERAKQEAKNGCKQNISVKTNLESGLNPLKMLINLFFPSDAKAPKETMLNMTGEFSLEPEGKREYTVKLNYHLARYAGREKGNLSVVRLRPVLSGGMEQIAPFFLKTYPNGTAQLDAEGEIKFQVTGGESWLLDSGTFRILDGNGLQVAATELPIFIPR